MGIATRWSPPGIESLVIGRMLLLRVGRVSFGACVWVNGGTARLGVLRWVEADVGRLVG